MEYTTILNPPAFGLVLLSAMLCNSDIISETLSAEKYFDFETYWSTDSPLYNFLPIYNAYCKKLYISDSYSEYISFL